MNQDRPQINQITGLAQQAMSLLAALSAALLMLSGCGSGQDRPKLVPLRIFYGSGFAPIIDALRAEVERDLHLHILGEPSGSQAACRKVTDLQRDCDLLILSDSELVASHLAGVCSWRLDFATDEVVLGISPRAPAPSEAETDWTRVLLRPDVRLGRVNENLAPIGYRTLMVWQLRETQGMPGLADRLRNKCTVVVDDVSTLAALLKAADLDYAFIHRSTAVAWDIRHVELDRRINLGDPNVDYSAAVVTYERLKAGAKELVTVHGGPVCWTLTFPDRNQNPQPALAFMRFLLTQKCDVLERHGLRPLRPPLFYGPADRFPGDDWAHHAGSLK